MRNFMLEYCVNIIQKCGECLADGGDFSKITIQSIRVVLLKTFLAETFPDVLEWLANSPDLNPIVIENLWSIVKHNAEKRILTNISELKQYLVEEWEKIPSSMLSNLVLSMNRRCQMVIDNNGERIDY